MDDPVYIQKFQPDPEGLDFESLRRGGLTLLQDLSGKSWTDYNLHDPGVTILEVLCYALTDLLYRTEFEVADFLTDKNGSIDFDKRVLFPPQDIFSSQAVTLNDYRKLIYDSIPEIDNVWITPAQSSPSMMQNDNQQGLYCISVLPAEMTDKKNQNELDRHRIIEKVRCLFAANRNLCEDLMKVRIVEPKYYNLHGTIEIGGQQNPNNILAEIYFKTAKFLCAGLAFKPFDEMLRRGKSLEEIFTGPLTQHGYISAADLNFQREYAEVSELIGMISDIDGVEYVDTLSFGGGYSFIEYDPARQFMPCLHFPDEEKDIAVALEKNGRQHPVELNHVRAEFERLQFEDRALRRIRQDITKVCDLPHGEHRKFSDYYSIQHHFPEIYGIGRDGQTGRGWPATEQERLSARHDVSEQTRPLAESKKDSARRQARARQLKAYLLLFEQTMANFLEGLQELPRLFSLDHRLQRSYFHQLLTDEIVPDIEALYFEKPDQVDAHIAQFLSRYDNFEDRRSRILDYLLGIYGEKFEQNSLRRFRYDLSTREQAHELISNKIAFLERIVDLNRTRAGAFNYLEASWGTENNSCLKKKVHLLLGLRNLQTCSLTRKSDAKECEGFHVVEHILLRPLSRKPHDMQIPDVFYAFKISVLFPIWAPRFKNKDFRKLAEETVRLNCPAHILPVFYWLDEEKMDAFETFYRSWLDKKSNIDSSDAQIDVCSLKLIEFLLAEQKS